MATSSWPTARSRAPIPVRSASDRRYRSPSRPLSSAVRQSYPWRRARAILPVDLLGERLGPDQGPLGASCDRHLDAGYGAHGEGFRVTFSIVWLPATVVMPSRSMA